MARVRLATAALTLLVIAAQARKPPQGQRGQPRLPPPRPSVDAEKGAKDYMMGCMRGARDAAQKRECRRVAHEQYRSKTARDPNVTAGMKEAFFEKAVRGAAKDRARGKVQECLATFGKSKAQIKDCMKRARSELGPELLGYMKPGKSAAQQAKLKGAWEKKVSREVLSDVFSSCIQAGKSRTECLAWVKSRKDDAGLPREDAEGIVKRGMSRGLRKPLGNCSGDLKLCREMAKDEAISKGMRRREYAAMKKMGEVKAAAEVWASCKESGEDDASCEAMLKDEFLRVSGAREEDLRSATKERAKRLGKALKDGESIILVKFKRMLVSAFTDGAECNATKEDLFAAKAFEVAKASNSAVLRAMKLACRMTDARPELSARVEVGQLPDAEIEALADATASGLAGQFVGRRLEDDDAEALPGEDGGLGRRLYSLSEVFAAQDVAECAASDTACTSDGIWLAAPAGPGTASAPASISGSPRAVAISAGALAAGAVALLL